ncbi:Uncharacterized conserved protein, DUF302 family [Thiothrix caldifontis]|uniref:Uncharacterized conserved protein, DUF302 family n=1 Tax=Thiothrix caldifontis TaxID=525918 RepID=A0A1H3VVD9_9GAMM|nr:DUF302 domain-containing protein [Thiothrix caldifontis]SDZ78747.1 Uncharacterized conserved protein, DUF302 family [Thiothrix caldifontis]
MKTVMAMMVGAVVGVVVTAAVGWNVMPGMMLHEAVSPLSTAETVDKIKANALSKGWVVSDVKPLHESIKKHGGKDLKPVMLVNLCQATHASNILEQDQNKKISVFMPCTISVYEKSDGKAYIGSMNAGLLGAMFGGKVAEVMKDVSAEQQSFIAFAQ